MKAKTKKYDVIIEMKPRIYAYRVTVKANNLKEAKIIAWNKLPKYKFRITGWESPSKHTLHNPKLN